MSNAEAIAIEFLRSENTRLRDESTNAQRELAQVRDENARLQQRLAQVIQQLRGKRSEKLNPAELFEVCLPFFSKEELSLFPEPEQVPVPPQRQRKRPARRRKLIHDDLPREPIEILLEADRRQCPACSLEMPRIGFDTSERLSYRPAAFVVKEYRLEKCACPCGKGIASATLPAQLIPKGKAAPDLLTYVMVAKFCDHLPFYRLSKMFARHGVTISDTTLVEWSNQVADALEVIVFLMTRQLLDTGYVQADETGLRVIVKGKGECHPGYLWAYGNPGSQVLFDFRMSRSRDGPLEFLKDFRGHLQSDAYPGYDELKKRTDITGFACWAHARRYFKETQQNAKTRSSKVLKFIQEMYRIEADARGRGLSAVERQLLRQERARPILKALEDYLRRLEMEVLPKSDLGKAVSYCLKRWDDFTRYVDHGEVEIDNNLHENALRGVGLGRKNYMFAGSESGGRKAAVLYSIIETCKRLGLDPYAYLLDVLTRLPTTPQHELEQLTPVVWKRVRETASTEA